MTALPGPVTGELLALAVLAAAVVLVWSPAHPGAGAGDGPTRAGAGAEDGSIRPDAGPADGPGRPDAGAGDRAAPSSAGPADGPVRMSGSWLQSSRRVLARRLRSRGEAPDVEELHVVDTVAAALEGGLPVSRAVGLALDRAVTHPRGGGPEWDIVVRAAREGDPLAPAWERLARRSGTPTLGAVSRAWTVAARTGAPLAEALRVSALVARERRRLESAVDAASAGARATATVLTCLPLAGIALAAVLGVPPTVLYATPVAWTCLAAGAALLLVGQVLVRRLVADVLRSAQ